MSEQEYSDLRKYAFNVAIHFCQNYDLAEDIAQNSMIKLYNREDINNPKPWLYTVVKNGVFKHTENTNKEKDLINISIDKQENNSKQVKISESKLKSLLGAKYAKIYKEFVVKSNSDLELYAQKYKLSKNTAYKRSYALNKTLTAIFKHEDGWRGSKGLLRFEEMKALVNFLNKLNKGEKTPRTFECEKIIYPTPNFEIKDITISIKDKKKRNTTYRISISTKTSKGIEFTRYHIYFIKHSIIKVEKCCDVLRVTKLPDDVIIPEPVKGIIPGSIRKLNNI